MTNIYDDRVEKLEEYVKRNKFSIVMLKKTLCVNGADLKRFLGIEGYEKICRLCKEFEMNDDNVNLPRVSGIQGSAIVASQETGIKIENLRQYRLSLTESQIASLYVQSAKRQK